jgi:hypothetical protein
MDEHIPEWRRRGGRHSLASLLKQRVYQIACGYEDQNDAGSLRIRTFVLATDLIGRQVFALRCTN